MADQDDLLVLGRGGVSLDDLIRLLEEIEGEGAMEEFLRWSPKYIVDVELLRTLLQRGQGNISRGSPQGRAGPVANLTSPPFPNFPNASSVRYFVSLISQLLEEQCPMRQCPSTLLCEDRCLAALQIAIHECLKIVRLIRQNESCGGTPPPTSPETPCSRSNNTANYSPPPPLSPGSPCNRNNPTPPPPEPPQSCFRYNSTPPPPEQSQQSSRYSPPPSQLCGRSRAETPKQCSGPPPAPQGQCSRKPEPACGATMRIPEQDFLEIGNPSPPPPSACNAAPGCSRPAAQLSTPPRTQPGAIQPPKRVIPSCGANMEVAEEACERNNLRASYPPTRFPANFKMDGGHNATANLARLLDAIPNPPPCPLRPLPTVEVKCPTRTCGIQQTKYSESNQPGKSRKPSFPPVAGQWSDGMGGAKIKDSPYDGRSKATYDGYGYSKPKGIED